MSRPDFSLRFNATEIASITQQIISDCDKTTFEIINAPSKTFETAFVPFHRSETIAADWSCKLVLASMVHVDKNVRESANEWKGKLKNWFENRYSDGQIFDTLKRAAQVGVPADPIHSRLVSSTLGLFKKNGVDLLQKDRDILVDLRNEISKLEYEFQSNLGEDLSFGEFPAEALEGCSQNFIDSLEQSQDGSKLIVTCKPPHVRAIMETCQVETTRQALLNISHSRCKTRNSEILKSLVVARSKAASILGFKSWAEYKLQGTMAGNSDNVWKMLIKLHSKLSTKLESDLEKLKLEKKREVGSLDFHLWDLAFYEKLYLKNNFQIDEKVVKKHLPMQYCIRKVMSIYEYLFQIEFAEIHEESLKWHTDVYHFQLSDSSSKKLLGYFYLDLFARPGKYAHQCVIPLSTGTAADGYPVVANISNLSSKGDEQNPALLAHGELITFFHEFGHAVHALVGKQEYPIFSWSWKAVPYEGGVEIDFLEVPSKGFEFFAWEKDVLKRVTCDFTKIESVSTILGQKTTDKPPLSPYPLPQDLVERILESKNVFSGYDYERMVFMTAFDMLVHSIPSTGKATFPKEVIDLLPAEIFSQDLTLERVDEATMLEWWTILQKHFVKMETATGTNPLASWYHIAMGYDAGYYGYLWSETVAADIYKTLFDQNLSQENGMKLRKKVLSKEASFPAISTVKDLLGREPDADALLKSILG